LSPLVRQKDWICPGKIENVKDVEEYLHNHYLQHYEESIDRLIDFESLEIDTLAVSNWTIGTSFRPGADNTVDLGASTLRFKNLYLSGNMTDDTNTLTISQGKSAYTHSQVSGGNSVHVSTAENTAWDSGFAHVSNNGTDHSYINQDLRTSASPTFAGLTFSGNLSVRSNAELRFYDNGNYVGFEAPALGADQIWVLPNADGLANDVLGTDAGGNLMWITGTSLGNVVAAGNFGTDNVILRSDGTGKGVQHTGIVVADTTNNVSGMGTLGCGAISTTGATIIDLDATPSVGQLFLRAGTVAGISALTYSADNSYLCFDMYYADSGWKSSDAGSNFDIQKYQDLLKIRYDSGVGVGSAPTMNDGIVLDTAGNVGIGTASPLADLHLSSISNTNLMWSDSNTAEDGKNWDLLVDGVNFKGRLVNDANDAATNWLEVVRSGTTTTSVSFPNGNVVIGTGNLTLQSATSIITGGTRLSILAGAEGVRSATIYADTTVSASNVFIEDTTSWIKRSTSAEKYKDKIENLELESSLIYNLRPVSFNSKCDGDNKDRRFIGLIADEIEQYCPEIVNYNENNEAESYDNQMLMTLLLAETQNQGTEIQKLRQEMDELKGIQN